MDTAERTATKIQNSGPEIWTVCHQPLQGQQPLQRWLHEQPRSTWSNGHGWANGHENSKFRSGNSHCSSSTLLRPTTPKTTTTAWTTSLQRGEFPLTNPDKSALSNTTKKFILFLEIRTVLCRPFWGQQPQKRRWLPNQPRLSESSTFSLSNETKKLALSTASSLYIPN